MNVTTPLLMSMACLSCVAIASEEIWITMDADSSQHFQVHNSIRGNHFEQLSIANSDIKALKVPEHYHSELSAFMHDEYHRCGGFVAHDSLESAQSYLAQLETIDPAATLVNYSIDNPERVNSLLSKVNTANLSATVSSLTSFYNRYYTSQSGIDAAQWVKQNWSDIAASRSDITVEYFSHSWAQSSVIVTIAGSELSDEIVVIGGHLDSINQSNSSGLAPGADDNASGIAVLTQALKAIVADGYKPQRTIQIMGFAAEEVGLRGSKAIAQAYSSQGKNVVGMAQFDMTGRNGSSADIVMMTDYTNSAQNQFLGQLIETYLPNLTYAYDQCGYGCSDHASWYQQGFPASMPFESRMSDINRKIHTTNDTEFDATHAQKFAKLALAFVAEIGKNAGDPPPPLPDNKLENGVAKTGISGNAKSQQFFIMEVAEGASNLSFSTSGGSGDADLYVRFDAKPTLETYDCKSTNSTSNEQCDITTAQAGTYHIMVEAWNAISGVSLLGKYDTSSGNPPIDKTVENIAVASGQWQYFTQALGAGYQTLTISTSGGTGDADLYVNFGTQPDTGTYQCRPYKNGNNEQCTISTPQAGTWHIGLQGYQAANNVTLSISAN
ncbi:M20/M25/M40 family metallo-hydrolase [Pseudoalteromonas sp. McH1-7]|uniref:M28 family metallopeptidase n=1 Tax=unclassified Pseudoalteromonas TaxID=194690 RepID=UPI0015907185|nr:MULTISPECIES: M28 family metallopeptidase [unclassified Pseudoalteromonas]NUZ12223.1 M20/M25/M40 family metallo-hydrolase [Pseudoalteromonas sp. McH1-7]USD30767.1 M20/M25/M40 family metallo-hydrolase [Pseudoalteromonas sp. SCSIO 43201]